MPIFLDRHDLTGLTAADIAEAHPDGGKRIASLSHGKVKAVVVLSGSRLARSLFPEPRLR